MLPRFQPSGRACPRLRDFVARGRVGGSRSPGPSPPLPARAALRAAGASAGISSQEVRRAGGRGGGGGGCAGRCRAGALAGGAGGKEGESPRGAGRRHAGLHGAALRDRRRHSTTRTRRRRQLCPGEPQAAPGPPPPAFFLPCLRVLTAAPAGLRSLCSAAAGAGRERAFRWAGAAGEPLEPRVAAGGSARLRPRACDLGPGAELPRERREGLPRDSPAATGGAGGMPGTALLLVCYRGLPSEGRGVRDTKANSTVTAVTSPASAARIAGARRQRSRCFCRFWFRS